MIQVHINGGPRDGEILDRRNDAPIEFTEFKAYGAPAEGETDERNIPTRTFSLRPARAVLPNGVTRWVVVWPRLESGSVPA